MTKGYNSKRLCCGECLGVLACAHPGYKGNAI